jgi:hypothetical protein
MRHPHNKNLVVTAENTWQGLPILDHRGLVVVNYLQRIHQVMGKALTVHPRTCAFRCDLRFPAYGYEPDTAVISRFIDSLKAQMKADELRKIKAQKRVHSNQLRYIWVKECDSANNWHYHVCLFVNRDVYFTLGLFGAVPVVDDGNWDSPLPKTLEAIERKNMAERIRIAWASALGMRVESTIGLVHFPENATYHLNVNSMDFYMSYQTLFNRLSYFAKADTKHYGDGSNCFGASRM